MKRVDEPVDTLQISLTVNGQRVQEAVPTRRLMSDFLRDDLGLTGTHVGCEHGVCGACTVHLDGRPVRSCLMFAVQCDGLEVTTVEGITPQEGLHPLQQAFKDHHGLQCGFCTPGVLMTVLGVDPDDYADEEGIREMLSGVLCRCTGYVNIVAAVQASWGRAAAE